MKSSEKADDFPIETLLKELVNAGVDCAAVINQDGILIASTASLPEKTSLMVLAFLSLGQRITEELHLGKAQQIYVRWGEKYAIILPAGEQKILLAVADRKAKLGLILFELQRISCEVAMF